MAEIIIREQTIIQDNIHAEESVSKSLDEIIKKNSKNKPSSSELACIAAYIACSQIANDEKLTVASDAIVSTRTTGKVESEVGYSNADDATPAKMTEENNMKPVRTETKATLTSERNKTNVCRLSMLDQSAKIKDDIQKNKLIITTDIIIKNGNVTDHANPSYLKLASVTQSVKSLLLNTEATSNRRKLLSETEKAVATQLAGQAITQHDNLSQQGNLSQPEIKSKERLTPDKTIFRQQSKVSSTEIQNNTSDGNMRDSKLTYTFSEWGKGHQVRVQLAEGKIPLMLQPSDNLVQQRLADHGTQQQPGQPEWVFADEQEQREKQKHSDEFDEERP